MILQYWGTAASEGWPAPFCRCEACRKARELGGKNIRTRSQARLDKGILLDFPADTYMHALRYGADLSDIRRLFITHSHMDHFYPEDIVIRVPPYAHELKEPMLSVYGNDVVISALKSCIKNCGIDESEVSKYLETVELRPFDKVECEGYTVTPLPADHIKGENCFMYFIEKDGSSLLYAHDTGWFPDESWDFLKGRKISLLSIDCTFLTMHCRHNHLGLPEIRELEAELRSMGCLNDKSKVVINHFSHNIHLTHDELQLEAAKSGYITAYDSMSIEF